MTARPSVTVCIVSHQRPQELREAVGSVPRDEVAQVVVVDSASEPPLEPVAGTDHVRCDENVACGGGRNVAAAHATGDVLLFLDDDAVLLDGAVPRIRDAFAADPSVGAVATHLVRAGGMEERIEQPFRVGHPLPSVDADCAYFIGAGFAVRRDLYRRIGGSDERMKYGGDDIELAMRVLQSGARIRWLADARVEHRPSTRGRMASGVKAGSHAEARILLARRFLPLPVAVLHAGAWLAVTGREARAAGELGPWRAAVRRGLAAPVDRRRIPARRLVEIHRLGGRVLF